MLKIAVQYWHYYAVNGQGKGIRGRIAHALLQLARRIDTSQWYLTISLDSSPELTTPQKAKCLAHGFRHAECLFVSEVRTEAGEIGLRAVYPDLFEREDTRG